MAFTRRALMLGTGAAIGAVTTRWVGPQNPSLDGVSLFAPAGGEGTLNDASGLSETPVFSHAVLQEEGAKLADRLRVELGEAQTAGRAVNIGAARHSMGGQAIPRDGQAVSLDNGRVDVAQDAAIYRAHAGARWSQVIATLDPLGLSPRVMQSNNNFGVAATFSVNAHGWPAPFGPMGSTVRSVGLVLADGSSVTASRTENADLFSAAMGGYGLIGLITDLTLEAAPNQLLEPTFEVMTAEDFGPAFVKELKDGGVPMAYGRLNVDRAGFFREAMLVTYRPAADQSDIPAASGSGFMSKASRHIFRAQVGNEWAKRRRWGIETGFGARFAGAATRNSLLNEPVITLDDRDPARTDILHEYFVLPEAFPAFLQACREIIAGSYQELLNVTLRYVAADTDSVLAFAPTGPRIAAVMLFSQETTARAEADMARMTSALIDAVLAIGGSYYLPYRPHATLAQFKRAYPRAAEFVMLKRRTDPALTLRNGLWDNYLSKI